MLKSLFHWKVLVNFIVAAAIFVGLVWLTFRWLEYHTNHGKEIPVPNVINRSVHDAIKILEDSGLDYEVDSFKYDPRYRPLQVLKIYPSPGSRVKNGRTVMLRVNPKSYAPVSVPDIIDRYKGLAFRQLEQVGLKVGDTIFEPSIQRDAVLRMMLNGSTLKPGTLLPRFTTIDLVIGAGPRRNIAVPNLVGLTVQEAKAIIANNLFEIGLVEHEDGGSDDSDIVYYQDPASFDLRDQGMQIDIWASKKTPAEMGRKISQLNAIYRIKIDTTLPPIRYEEVPAYTEPVPTEPAVTKKTETKPAETKPKAEEKPKNTGTTPPKTSTSTPTKTPAPAEKPKAKKLVIE
ncbi:PASTA domain-containing protein [Chryseobacterium sp.]|uniref:PASTA domain-containing protein n=1 Tax=Chryseobacterium sp. TaxID=1871047 RepID=UPI0011CB9904|nr:PASTA domain-containing protein [Chryseobacterium sp.]TXF75191.1 PASTA domain-containing protein [Chryseobacterium sp.]